MIRIIHVTDFHLNTTNLRDWNDYIKDAMLLKIDELQNNQPITFFASTGDQIDRGGSSYKGVTNGMKVFEENVIEPLVSKANLKKEDFFMIPGNHDIDRNKDSKRMELGNQALFKNNQELADSMSNAIRDQDFEGMSRIQDYKEFEKEFYKDSTNDSEWDVYGSSYRIQHGVNKIGVCCLNNSWRCYSNEDKGNLILGEQQLVRATKFVKDCDIKIALVHHPLDLLASVERKTISEHIHLEFDLLLLGHSHETITNVQTGHNGSLFINLAPSGLNDIRSDSRTFSNGFTVIDYDKNGLEIKLEYWRYNHNKKKFVLNTDEGNDGEGGRSTFPIMPATSSNNNKVSNIALQEIKNEHFRTIDCHLVGSKAQVTNKEVSIKEGFIFPPITKGEGVENQTIDELVTLSQIIKLKTNLFFFGGHEAGKTALLFRLIREYVDEFEYIKKIPVYINLYEIQNKEIINICRDYLGLTKKEIELLIKENKLVLFVDNFNYGFNIQTDIQIRKIEKFLKNNEDVRIIATGSSDFIGIAPKPYLEKCSIAFRNYFINNFRTKEIKELMKLWIPDEEDAVLEEKRVERLVKTFESYSLPSTAMSVSLFLWSTEYSNREPINEAVLLEIYIEIILEKMSQKNIYRKTFDFTNKIQLLANIAFEMLSNPDEGYSLNSKDLKSIIKSYLNKVGFDHDVEVIFDYFLDRKIFITYNVNKLKFSNSCFFHFFLAKRMVYDTTFKNHVMNEFEYYKFPKELDYYTGLVRSDESVFQMIYDRFIAEFSKTNFIVDQMQEIDIDEYFTPPLSEVKQTPIANKIEISNIKDNRPSKEMLDSFHDRRLQKIKNPDLIITKNEENSLGRQIYIMSTVLRNSEGVENLVLKQKSYNALIKYSMVYMILYKESMIDFVLKNNRLPVSVPLEFNFNNYIKNIPLYIQLAMQRNVGTPKLNTVIGKKLNDDINKGKSISDIERFLSASLYSELHGKNHIKLMKKSIKLLKNNANNYVTSDYIFYKLIDHFYRKTKEGSIEEEDYLNLLTELKLRSEKLPQRMKARVILKLKEAKAKFTKSIN